MEVQRWQMGFTAELGSRIIWEEQRSLWKVIKSLSISNRKAEAKRVENHYMEESPRWHGLYSRKMLLTGSERIEAAQGRLLKEIGNCLGLRRIIWILRLWIWVMISARTIIKLSTSRNPIMISDPVSCCLASPTLPMRASTSKLWTRAEACKVKHVFGQALGSLKSTLLLLQATSSSKWTETALKISNLSND